MAREAELSFRSAQLRLKAMQVRLAAAFSFCSTAETALYLGNQEHARQAIENARQTALNVRVHLDVPNHVPADSVRGVRDSLTELEESISRLEMRFRR